MVVWCAAMWPQKRNWMGQQGNGPAPQASPTYVFTIVRPRPMYYDLLGVVLWNVTELSPSFQGFYAWHPFKRDAIKVRNAFIESSFGSSNFSHVLGTFLLFFSDIKPGNDNILKSYLKNDKSMKLRWAILSTDICKHLINCEQWEWFSYSRLLLLFLRHAVFSTKWP